MASKNIAFRPAQLDGCWATWTETWVDVVARTDFENGSMRTRRRFTGKAKLIDASVRIDASFYDLFCEWFLVNQQQGALPTKVKDPQGKEIVVQWTEPPKISWPDALVFQASVKMYQHPGDTATAAFRGASVMFTDNIKDMDLQVGQAITPVDIGSHFKGDPAPTVAVVGALPDGLVFTASTGMLTGTPTKQETLEVSFAAYNDHGQAASNGFTITTLAGAPAKPVFTGQTPDVKLIATIAMSDIDTSAWFSGTPAPSYSVTGPLPLGLAIDPNTGIISGTPKYSEELPGIRVVATNNEGTDTSTAFKFIVAEAPAPPKYTGEPLGTVYFATGTKIQDINIGGRFTSSRAATYTIVKGALPAGLTFSSSGVLSGTPTGAVNPDQLVFRASNTAGSTDSPPMDIRAATAPAFTGNQNDLSLTIGAHVTEIDFGAMFTGGPDPTFEVVGTLPWGMTFDKQNGVLGGWPVQAETATGLIVRATNFAGTADSNAFDIVVA